MLRTALAWAFKPKVCKALRSLDAMPLGRFITVAKVYNVVIMNERVPYAFF